MKKEGWAGAEPTRARSSSGGNTLGNFRALAVFLLACLPLSWCFRFVFWCILQPFDDFQSVVLFVSGDFGRLSHDGACRRNPPGVGAGADYRSNSMSGTGRVSRCLEEGREGKGVSGILAFAVLFVGRCCCFVRAAVLAWCWINGLTIAHPSLPAHCFFFWRGRNGRVVR